MTSSDILSLEEAFAEAGLKSSDASAAMGLLGLIAGMGIVVAIVGLIVWVLLIIALWKIFTKAGEQGWKSLIPIYNVYVYCKILGIVKWFWIALGVGLGSSILSAVPVLGAILAFANFVVMIIFAVFMARNGAKAFGKSTGFAVGLFFLPNIFLLILGLGSAEYKGVPGNE